jgi:hypothetical protein
MDEIIIDTLEIGDPPVAACPAEVGFRDSAQRMREIDEAYFKWTSKTLGKGRKSMTPPRWNAVCAGMSMIQLKATPSGRMRRERLFQPCPRIGAARIATRRPLNI